MSDDVIDCKWDNDEMSDIVCKIMSADIWCLTMCDITTDNEIIVTYAMSDRQDVELNHLLL